MNCKTFQKELPDLVLTPGARPSPAAVAHMRSCPPCADEFLGFQDTFAALGSWESREPSPYFDQRLSVRIREEQTRPAMGFFERLRTRMLFNTGEGLRPAMAGVLALALVGVGGGFAGSRGYHVSHAPQASATVNDLQILDRNEQAFQQMDELQQEDDNQPSLSQDPESGKDFPPPTS